MSKLREQLIQIQKRNYRKNIRLVKESLDSSPAIEKYESEYWNQLKDYQEISSKQELLKQVLASDIVYHGDYHCLKQSQRSVLRILRDVANKRNVVLCLEMVHIEDQKYLEEYQKGQISESQFLNKINYHEKWPFQWKHWKPIIEYCVTQKIPMVGINSQSQSEGKGIRNRDLKAAQVIVKTLIKNPDSLIYVMDGDYHVSPNHLPKEVKKLLVSLDIEAKRLIVYQNAENLYWKLCREKKEESDVLKINEESFCVMNTMPANKIQSYLNWLEFAEDAYFPSPVEWEDDNFGSQGLTVHNIIESVAGILEIDINPEDFDKLSIFYSSDYEFMDYIDKSTELKGMLRQIKAKLKRDEGFLIEYVKEKSSAYIIYLPNSNINMAAEEASHFLNVICRGPLKKNLSSFDRFYRDVITECLGYFGSKFINEKRKSQTENSLRHFLSLVKQGKMTKVETEYVEGAHLMLQHLHLEKRRGTASDFKKKFKSLYDSRAYSKHMISTQLGYTLGNKLFNAVKRGKFSLKKIRELFFEPLDEPKKGFEIYTDLVHSVRKIRVKSSVK